MLLMEKSLTNTAPLIVVVGRHSGPLTIAVAPGAGATLAVELSMDNGRNYSAWEPGSVTAAANATTSEGQTPTHIKVTQTVAATTSYVVLSK